MLILYHGIEAENDLLRGEVLAILESMATRLGLPKFKEYLNIPVSHDRPIQEQRLHPSYPRNTVTDALQVMAVSIIYNGARVLQAYWTARGLVSRRPPKGYSR